MTSSILSGSPCVDRTQGKGDDQAHPPIHPLKLAENLTGDEKRLYEFVVRHFLAVCSKDGQIPLDSS